MKLYGHPRSGGGGGASGRAAHARSQRGALLPKQAQPIPSPLPPVSPMEDARAAEEKTAAAPLELRPGTVVRISQVKGAFEKDYAPNSRAEDFRIARVVPKEKGVQ